MKKVIAIIMFVVTVMAIIATISHADFLNNMVSAHLIITDTYTFSNGEEISICWSERSKIYKDSAYCAGTIKSWGDQKWFMLPEQWYSILIKNDVNYNRYKHETFSWEW